MSDQKSADTLRVTITASATIAQVHTIRPSRSEMIAFYEREPGKPLVNRAAPSFKIRDEDEVVIKRAAERAMDEASVLQRKLAPMPKPEPVSPAEACWQAIQFLNEDEAWEDRKRRETLRTTLWQAIYGAAPVAEGATGDEATQGEAQT